ncbi:MAG: hypothetical protein V7711_00960 [Pseudomonadales bacterium]
MPLSLLGIFHTIVGGGAVLGVIYLLWRDKQITLENRLGQIYLVATVVTAATALGIYKHGEPNAAHFLAALTIAAVVVGVIASTTTFLGGYKKYIVALCFSATVLFHALPTATEILTRFPAEAPMVGSLEDPLLQKTFLVILVIFTLSLLAQMNWLRKQP